MVFFAGLAVSYKQLGSFKAPLEHSPSHLIFTEDILGFLFTLDTDFIEGRLSDVNHPVLYKLAHLPEEEGQKKGPDMCTVDVGVGHKYNLAVPAFGYVELVGSDTGAQSAYYGSDFFMGEHFVYSGLFNVEDFSFEGQDGLGISVTSGLCRAAGRVALNYENFGGGLFPACAIPQFAGQICAAQGALSPCQLAGLSGGNAGGGGLDGLVEYAP